MTRVHVLISGRDDEVNALINSVLDDLIKSLVAMTTQRQGGDGGLISTGVILFDHILNSSDDITEHRRSQVTRVVRL